MNGTCNVKLAAGLSDCIGKYGFESARGLADIPYELLLHVLNFLRPSDVLRLSLVSRSLMQFISCNENTIASAIISHRYQILARCFLLPLCVDILSETERDALQSQIARGQHNGKVLMHRHLSLPSSSPDICICFACTVSWVKLNIILDQSHSQVVLNREGFPPTCHSESQEAVYNAILARHHAVVTRAIAHPLTYAAILEKHLVTTVGIISRNLAKTPDMSSIIEHEVRSGTDVFLNREMARGASRIYTSRCGLYGKTVWLPGRKWNPAGNRWAYTEDPAHRANVDFLVWKRKQWRRRGLAD